MNGSSHPQLGTDFFHRQAQDEALGSDFDAGAAVLDMCMTPDSRFVACVTEESTVKVYDSFSGMKTIEFTDFNHQMTAVSFYPKGTQMVTGSADGFITFWDTSEHAVREGVVQAHPLSRGLSKGHQRINRVRSISHN
jgi:WD40 repeat protein